MSALVAVVTETRLHLADPLPAVVRLEINAFCRAGHTGQIVLNIKDGEIRSANVNRSVDARTPLDETSEGVPR